MTGGILKSKELHTSQTTINVSAGMPEIYATTLVDAKLGQEALFYIYEVQNRSIKKHCLEEAS
jgi:CRISPR/Cas system-associated protein Csm6